MGWHELMHVPPESRTWRHGGRTMGRKVFARLPAEPRCKLCAAPFTGIGGRLVGPLGFRPSQLTPFMCGKCETLAKREGGDRSRRDAPAAESGRRRSSRRKRAGPG